MENLKFTANYSNTNHNFIIQNLKGKKQGNKYSPVICILKNLLQRGRTTMMSCYLKDIYGDIYNEESFKDNFALIDNEEPIWINRIKGDDEHNYYPARSFFKILIPKYLSEYPFLQQLILPEAAINDIAQYCIESDVHIKVESEAEKFTNQCVDFYLPQAKLVIEIDGQQHKINDAGRINDIERDEYLKRFGIYTVRIDTHDLEEENQIFIEKINEILQRLREYDNSFKYYRNSFSMVFKGLPDEIINKKLIPTAIIRLQITILEMIEKGLIRLDDKAWNINILERDVGGFARAAIDDLFLWLENLCKLQKIVFKLPVINLNESSSLTVFNYLNGSMNIDLSLLKRWTDENDINPNVIFIRTDYYDRFDYFKVSTTKPIEYKIIGDGKDSDMPALKFFLKNIFGFENFIDGQLPIIINALSRVDTVGILPTGGGKSLCYQMVSLLQPCVSFVVSPIKALMYDQKCNLDMQYINRVNYITGDMRSEEKEMVQRKFSNGRYLFIWISPERFQSKQFRNYLSNLNTNQSICYAVIDEVHCLSEWGHQFRVSYLFLYKTIKKYAPDVRFLGLTATASINVLKDIETELGIEQFNVKTLVSYTRPELEFKVIKDDGTNANEKYDKLKQLLIQAKESYDVFILDGENTKCGIIFTSNVNGKFGCYRLCNNIKNDLLADSKWYAGQVPNGERMGPENFDTYRMGVQRDFKKNKFPLLTATKAFGMGIDKKNIRYTIHYGIPDSVESLYQEAGRAGRDKKNAKCYVLYSKEIADEDRIDRIFDLHATRDDIKNINDEIRFDGRDIMRNIFLWLVSNEDIKTEFKIIKSIYNNHCRTGQIETIYSNEYRTYFEENAGIEKVKSVVEKCIYRLTLLGVIKDWTVENFISGIYEITVGKYDNDSIKLCLLNYINKYDKYFKLSSEYINDSKYEEYIKIMLNENMELYEKYIMILLQWNYDNMAYFRRQSLKTVSDLCNEFSDSDEFKGRLESYFKFTDVTFILDYIAENPDDYEKWFEVFYEKDTSKFIDLEGLKRLRDNLNRFLESYRYNTGLNYISGMLRLLLSSFDEQYGKQRLESSFDNIKTYDVKNINKIIKLTLEIGSKMDNKDKEQLSMILYKYYPEKIFDIYQNLKDEFSLDAILGGFTKRLENVNRRLG